MDTISFDQNPLPGATRATIIRGGGKVLLSENRWWELLGAAGPSTADSRSPTMTASSRPSALVTNSRPFILAADSRPSLIGGAGTGGMAPRPSATEAAKQPPARAPKSHKATVKGDDPYLLTVHVSTDERFLIDEELFSGLVDEMEKAILTNQAEEVLELCCSFRRWAGERGLLGCQNKAMTD